LQCECIAYISRPLICGHVGRCVANISHPLACCTRGVCIWVCLTVDRYSDFKMFDTYCRCQTGTFCDHVHLCVPELLAPVLSCKKCQRGLPDQKSGHAPFLMQTVKTSYKYAAGKIWGEEDDPCGPSTVMRKMLHVNAACFAPPKQGSKGQGWARSRTCITAKLQSRGNTFLPWLMNEAQCAMQIGFILAIVCGISCVCVESFMSSLTQSPVHI